MSSSKHVSNRTSESFLGTYKYRLIWYIGAALITYGALGLPEPHFITAILVPGSIRYLMQSIPAALVIFITFAVLNGYVPEKTLGLKLEWLSRLIMGAGIALVAWGWAYASAAWGAIGINTIYWGAELMLLPRESRYWDERRGRCSQPRANS